MTFCVAPDGYIGRKLRVYDSCIFSCTLTKPSIYLYTKFFISTRLLNKKYPVFLGLRRDAIVATTPADSCDKDLDNLWAGRFIHEITKFDTTLGKRVDQNGGAVRKIEDYWDSIISEYKTVIQRSPGSKFARTKGAIPFRTRENDLRDIECIRYNREASSRKRKNKPVSQTLSSRSTYLSSPSRSPLPLSSLPQSPLPISPYLQLLSSPSPLR
ncbi:6450_t:CDS:2 [Acaulospora morrowiae]|uniref:6450_t:CDS:1 n=1 Tax=Acaulospora morrowiae TaxID=94023 RepID=A0A9N8YXA8_9GLOM|nr:6450_t:CDS:2 [Acaulospora morrowiae]